MRRLDIGFALLAVALVATLGWWWAGRYASERAALVDRVDVGIKSYRADRLRRAVTDLIADAEGNPRGLEVATADELFSAGPDVQIDLKRDRVIRIDRAVATPADSAKSRMELSDGLSRVLGSGFGLGASEGEVRSVLDSLAEGLGVVLSLRDAEAMGPGLLADTSLATASVFRTGALLVAASGAGGKRLSPVSYVAIEDYPRALLSRIAPEITVGLALLLGLAGFYAIVRRDLRRRTRASLKRTASSPTSRTNSRPLSRWWAWRWRHYRTSARCRS